MNLKLTKTTIDLQAACRELMTERDKLAPALAQTLSDDKTPLDAVAKKLGDLRARESVILSRLARRRDELYQSFAADVVNEFDAAITAMAARRAECKKEQAAWSAELAKRMTRSVAERISRDPGARPVEYRNAETEFDKARHYMGLVAGIMGKVCKGRAEADADARAPSQTGTPHIRPLSYYVTNAAEYIPELKA